MPQFTTLWVNARIATQSTSPSAYGIVRNAAIASKDGRIAWLGPMQDLPGDPAMLAEQVIDVANKWITPGLVDCHSHVVFGGNRADEFRMRLEGQSYEAIARQGGGIISTVKATREATEDELLHAASKRLQPLLREGLTTTEIKSGYGLDSATEEKMLRVARRLGRELPLTVATSFLGAHTVPPEFAEHREGYLDLVCDEMLPALHAAGLVDAVDAFCEKIAFSTAEVERLFRSAHALGLPVKLHAEQLSNGGGSELAARCQALSADHLEYLDEAGVKAMAASGTVAVLLPGAFYTLRDTRKPPVEQLRLNRVPMAIATDCNPGSSPVLSLRLIMNMACQLFGLTPDEALAGVTINAARALGLHHERGSLEPGKYADMVIWDINETSELSYWLGGDLVISVIKEGHILQD